MEYLDLDEEQSVELMKATVQLAHVARSTYLTTQGGDKSRG